MRRILLALALGAALAGATGATAVAAPATTVANPTVSGPVTGGVKGYPWNKSLFSLKGKGYDYSENEYFYNGTATDLSTGASSPYTSRMLVRLPKNPKKFSGGILVEWLNVTGQSDLETAWPVEAQYLMRTGSATWESRLSSRASAADRRRSRAGTRSGTRRSCIPATSSRATSSPRRSGR